MSEQENQTDVLVLDLRKPVAVGGKTYESVRLREPLAGELEAASRAPSGVASLISLIVIVAGVPRTVPEAMGSRDLARANAFFDSFSVPPADAGDGDDFIDEMTLTLRKPVSIGKDERAVTYAQLELVEPNGGQKDKASREPNDMRSAIALISAVAKVPRLVVEGMCRRDFEEACNFLASCNDVGQTIGATSLRS
jgi:hypothetical protein